MLYPARKGVKDAPTVQGPGAVRTILVREPARSCGPEGRV